MFSLVRKVKKIFLPLDIWLHLFVNMITPIFCMVLRFGVVKNVDIIDQFHLKFCKSLLDVKRTTPSVMVYGELGAMPLHLKIKNSSEILV